MKNIHVLPTTPNDETANGIWIKETRDWCNIYITSDEEIENCWFVNLTNNEIGYIKNNIGTQKNAKKIILTTDQDLIKDGVQAIPDEFLEWFVKNPSCERVEVEESNLLNTSRTYLGVDKYKIIIPKEEPKQDLEKEIFELEQELDIPSHLRWHNSKPKQETLEERVNKLSQGHYLQTTLIAFANVGAEWQQEQNKNLYSEEDIRKAYFEGVKSTGEGWNAEYANYNCPNVEEVWKQEFKEWFEQFKKNIN
jgi:hypothetical protein